MGHNPSINNNKYIKKCIIKHILSQIHSYLCDHKEHVYKGDSFYYTL